MKALTQIALALAVLIAVAGGIVVVIRQMPANDGAVQIVLPAATPAPEIALKVYVSGVVRNPGVYVLGEGDRLDDAIEASGGPTEEADLAAINLASRLKDEDHWHIPEVEDEVSAPTSVHQTAGASGKIDINSAQVDALTSLPGIGEVKAQAIVRYREKNGAFSSVDELADVDGIGPVTLNGLRDLVEVR